MDANNRTLECHDLTRGCDNDYFREDEGKSMVEIDEEYFRKENEEERSEIENEEEKSIICKHGYFQIGHFRCPICDRLK